MSSSTYPLGGDPLKIARLHFLDKDCHAEYNNTSQTNELYEYGRSVNMVVDHDAQYH